MSKSAFVGFTMGAVIGSALTWYFVKTKYERIADEEINSYKEAIGRIRPVDEDDPENDIPEQDESVEEEDQQVDVAAYARMLAKEGYTTDYTDMSQKDEKPEKKTMGIPGELPYTIPPEEFGDLDGYSQIELSYYADQVLADDNDEIVDDIESTVGFKSLTCFGEYEDDSVCVRNDRLRCDFQILLRESRYSDVIKNKPYKAGV